MFRRNGHIPSSNYAYGDTPVFRCLLIVERGTAVPGSRIISRNLMGCNRGGNGRSPYPSSGLTNP